jgi:uncharacterized membrane protein YozB (DUF420 family)
MEAKRPILVTFIGDLALLNAFLGIVALLPIKEFIEQFGIYINPRYNFLDGIISILCVISLLTISYGYFKIKRWGYWALLTYNLFFLTFSLIFILTENKNLYNTPSIIASLLGLMLTFSSKRYFIKENEPS